ncbi:MAG: hypothetical protein ACRDI1_06680 [Actinomycetota bacterium]
MFRREDRGPRDAVEPLASLAGFISGNVAFTFTPSAFAVTIAASSSGFAGGAGAGTRVFRRDV